MGASSPGSRSTSRIEAALEKFDEGPRFRGSGTPGREYQLDRLDLENSRLNFRLFIAHLRLLETPNLRVHQPAAAQYQDRPALHLSADDHLTPLASTP